MLQEVNQKDLSSSNNDDDATYGLLLLSNEVMKAKRKKMQCEYAGRRMKQADSILQA